MECPRAILCAGDATGGAHGGAGAGPRYRVGIGARGRSGDGSPRRRCDPAGAAAGAVLHAGGDDHPDGGGPAHERVSEAWDHAARAVPAGPLHALDRVDQRRVLDRRHRPRRVASWRRPQVHRFGRANGQAALRVGPGAANGARHARLQRGPDARLCRDPGHVRSLARDRAVAVLRVLRVERHARPRYLGRRGGPVVPDDPRPECPRADLLPQSRGQHRQEGRQYRGIRPPLGRALSLYGALGRR